MSVFAPRPSLLRHPLTGSGQIPDIPGLADLWSQTQGDPAVRVAVLDAPLDLGHPHLMSAEITQDWTGAFDRCSSHGTEVASVIFSRAGISQSHRSVRGIAPDCRGISVPIFDCDQADSARTDQERLAAAIRRAVDAGAQVINVSAGQLVPDGKARAELIDAVNSCADANVLIVAAAGNDGCDCLHVPAALPCVLSVGAMGRDGHPLPQSNWGDAYRQQGILALGEDVPVAGRRASTELRTGTSYAAAIISGVAALLLARERKRGRSVRPLLIREALLATAARCDPNTVPDCRRFLAGRLNLSSAMSYLDRWSNTMTEHANASFTAQTRHQPLVAEEERGIRALGQPADDDDGTPRSPVDVQTPHASYLASGEIEASACSSCRGERQLVFAIGRLGYGFGSEACLDEFAQQMHHLALSRAEPPKRNRQSRKGKRAQHEQEEPSDSFRPSHPLVESDLHPFLMEQLERRKPWYLSSLIWTVNVGGAPAYAIKPNGSFSEAGYKLLLDYLSDQIDGNADWIAVPGVIAGQVTLMNGLSVPVIDPDFRGLSNWTIDGLIGTVFEGGELSRDDERTRALRDLLQRIYFQFPSFGRTPRDRVWNYAGTNLFMYRRVREELRSKVLGSIQIDSSTLRRPNSDCRDITVTFFDPATPFLGMAVRYTVDVTDAIPVPVGELHQWRVRLD